MNAKQDVNLLWVGLLVEGGMIVLALVLGFFNIFDPAQPLANVLELSWSRLLTMGVLATLPLVVYFVLLEYWSPKFYQPMQEFIDQSLRPMFVNTSVFELAIIALLAGVGEEILFRWCLQGGVFALLTPMTGTIGALLISLVLVNLVFGLCHWVNNTYLVFAFLAGIYLGLVMWWSSSWIVAAFAHTAFDFIALMYLKHTGPGHSDELELQTQV